MKKSWTLVCALVFWSLTSFGFNARFQHLFTSNGLPENTGEALLQDSSGFIWIGTQNGLARYDGISVKVFKQSKQPNSISNNVIEGLIQDSHGYIWVTTRNGLNKYDPSTEKFTRFYVDSTLYAGPNFLDKTIIETDDGLIWFSNKHHVFSIHPESLIVDKHVIGNSTRRETIVLVKNEKNELIVSKGNTLYLFESKSFKQQSSLSQSITTLLPVGNDVLCGTQHGVFYAQSGRLLDQKLQDVFCLFIVQFDGSFWVGTTVGIFVLPQGKKSFWIKNNSNNPNSLSNNLCLSSLIANDGQLWIGTGQGVNTFNPRINQFNRIDVYSNNFVSLSNYEINSIAESKDAVWIGTEAGLFEVEPTFLFDGNNVQPKAHFESKSIAFIYVLSNDVITVGLKSGQVYQYVNNQWKPVDTETTIQGIRDMLYLEDRHELYIAGSDGLYVFDQSISKITRPKWMQAIDYTVQLTKIENKIWVSHSDQIFILDPASKKIDHIKKTSNCTNCISHHMVTGSLKIGNSYWISTFGGGISIFDPTSQSYQTINENSGLINDNVWSLYLGRDSSIWVSTDNGISRITLEKQITNYGFIDGLNFNDFSMNAHCQLKSGLILFGNPKGITAFDPQRITGSSNLNEVVLKQVIVNDVKSISIQRQISLSPDERTLSFDFVSPNFIKPHQVEYAYRLQGYDVDWKYSKSTNSFARYTSLPHGHYSFQVKARKKNEAWEESTLRQLPIIIHPAFYETTWFKIVSVLSLIGLLVFIVTQIQRKKHIKTINAMKTKQLMQEERERISKDLHDNLGANLTKIISDLDIMSLTVSPQRSDKLQERLADTRGFTKQTIDVLRETIWAMDNGTKTIEEFQNTCKLHFEKYFKNQPISFKHRFDAKSSKMEIQPSHVLHLFRILQEIAQNVLKHSFAKQFILEFETINDSLIITCSDNGIGISDQQKSQGYGLNNLRHRASEINANLEISSGNDGQGTVITIKLNTNNMGNIPD